MHLHDNQATICALITPAGKGAVGVIRVSGADTLSILDAVFKSRGKLQLVSNMPSHTVSLGTINENATVIDEVLITVFKNPRSYTGEDVVEISCHGSLFIQQKILRLLMDKGARMAQPGEFTLRAFLNGKLDLSQAEAVADIIASENENSHRAAMQQMRGGYSLEITKLRDQLIHFAAMLELELDFGEEDVEFANRDELKTLITDLKKKTDSLLAGFEWGNVLKNGIPVVIAGKPNVGKSTLLNALVNEERAIVSEIAGTTRDTIEEQVTIDGLRFMFIDTAGLRNTEDTIERIGVQRALGKAAEAAIVLYVFDPNEVSPGELKLLIDELLTDIKKNMSGLSKDPFKLVIVANKMDTHSEEDVRKHYSTFKSLICISARQKTNLDTLRNELTSYIKLGDINTEESTVTNARHAESLNKASLALGNVLDGLSHNLTHDLIASDVRHTINCLGEITGEVTNDDLLDFIFSKFCIGK